MGLRIIHKPLLPAGMIVLVVMLAHAPGLSQQPDATFQTKQVDRLTQVHSPGKAALLSAVFPGMGQVYNKKYWKLPILYGGGYFVYYLYDYYSKNYTEYSNAYASFVNGRINEYNGITTEEGLQAAREFYRRYRDLNVIVMVGVYVAGIIDATVDAYLYNFDVSDDLSLSPAALPAGRYRVVPGVRFTLQF